MINWRSGRYMPPRPDAVIRSSIIEPYFIQQISPVEAARHTIDPFIYGIRPPGPSVEPELTPMQIVHAAAGVADRLASGNGATVSVGAEQMTVQPSQGCPEYMPGPIGKIFRAAAKMLRREKFTVATSQGAVQATPASQAGGMAAQMAAGRVPGPPMSTGPAPEPDTGGGIKAAYITSPGS